MMTAPIRILIAAGLLTAALVYIVADRMTLLSSGRVVTLKVLPVDPTDMFRGDYVILTYAISRLDTGALEGDDEFDPNEAVYVVLRQIGEEWKAVAAHRARPTVAASDAIIKGRILNVLEESTPGDDKAKPKNVLSVYYGIESFFVPQGEGRPIESDRNKDNVTADIALASDGRAALKTLRVGGKPVFEETLF